MDLKCQDFYFKSGNIYGTFGTVKKFDSGTNKYYTDLEEQEMSIRIYGTMDQIDQALEEYMKDTDIILDECYDFKIEKRGTFWGDFYGKDLDKHNEEVQTKLDKFKKLYKEKNKAIIIRLI